MGGFESTRWHRHERKITVEDCLILSIGDLRRKGFSRDEVQELYCLDPRSRGVLACFSYSLDPREQGRPAILMTVGRRMLDGFRMEEQKLGLEPTVCNRYGGVRWWFTCPSPDGRCGHRRCGKLYLRPDGLILACRHCHDLTYESSLEGYKITRMNRLYARYEVPA